MNVGIRAAKLALILDHAILSHWLPGVSVIDMLTCATNAHIL